MIHFLVTPSLIDPFSGWVDNFYGLIGMIVGGGKGVLRVFNAAKHVCVDGIPVDIVIKSIIVNLEARIEHVRLSTEISMHIKICIFNCTKLQIQKRKLSFFNSNIPTF